MENDLYTQLMEYRNNHHGATEYLGIKLTEVKKGWARGEIVVNEHHMNPIGSVHGGVLFALADTVGGAAAWSYGEVVTTSSGSIHYLNAAINPGRIYAEATTIKAGKNLITMDIRIYDETGKMLCYTVQEYFNMHIPVSGLLENTGSIKAEAREASQ